MKVSADHYSILKGHAVQMMKDNNVTKNDWDQHYSGFTEQRKVWDLYWAVTNDVIGRECIRPLFYEYNDSHIETALKKLYSELPN